MTDTKTLTDAIDALVRDRTFTAEALTGIVALKARAAALEQQVEANALTREQTQQQLARTNDRLNEQLNKENAVTAREAAVAKRELDIAKLERDTAVAIARAEVWQQAVTLVFRNTIVRESMSGLAPHAGSANPQQYTTDTVAVSRDATKVAE